MKCVSFIFFFLFFSLFNSYLINKFNCNLNSFIKFSSYFLCPINICISLWIENMPLIWLQTTNYLKGKSFLKPPNWMPYNEINCFLTLTNNQTEKTQQRKTKGTEKRTKEGTKEEEEVNEKEECLCSLPEMNFKNLYLDYNLVKILLFGDSTIRNFGTFLNNEFERIAYSSLIKDDEYRKKYQRYVKDYLVDINKKDIPYFVNSLTEYENKMKNLLILNPFWKRVKSANSECLNNSRTHSSSIVQYISESYEELNKENVDFYNHAVENCHLHPDRLLIFLLTGGLHYLTVRIIIIIIIIICYYYHFFFNSENKFISSTE